MSVYSFREGPTYAAATREEMFTAAMDMPMNMGATFWDQAKGGALESFGLGTAIRGAAIPPGDTSKLSTMEQIGRTAESVLPGGMVGAIGGAFRRLTDEPSESLSEDAYKASPFFRDDVPWDASMTEARAASLASWHDAKRVREYFAVKRPITAFLGNVAGQAVDPINYIPVVGPTVQAAAAARVGRVIGTAATASADAALNTAIAGIATSSQRGRMGDDVSWQATVSEIATAALIGAAFGGIAGGIDARRAARVDAAARERLSTLQTTQEARIALNEGIDALARGEDINLSPNATAGVERLTREAQTAQAVDPAKRQADTGQPSSSAPVPALVAKDLDEIIDAEVTQGARERVRDVITRTRDRIEAMQDDIPPDIMDVIRNAVDRSSETGGRDLEAAIDIAYKADDLPSELLQQLESIQNLSRLPLKTFEEPSLRAYLKQDFEDVSRHFREQPLSKLMDQRDRALADPGSMSPTHMKALQDAIVAKGAIPALAAPARADNSPPRPEPAPTGRAEAEKTLTRTDDYAALKAQYRVDPETGDFLESVEIDQLRAEGRLTDEDIAALDATQAELDNGTAYGDALKAAVACII